MRRQADLTADILHLVTQAGNDHRHPEVFLLELFEHIDDLLPIIKAAHSRRVVLRLVEQLLAVKPECQILLCRQRAPVHRAFVQTDLHDPAHLGRRALVIEFHGRSGDERVVILEGLFRAKSM